MFDVDKGLTGQSGIAAIPGIEPFKNMLSYEVGRRIATAVARALPGFDRKGFLRGLEPALAPLELKDRMLCLADRLEAGLPQKPAAAFQALTGALAKDDSDLAGLRGFAVWPLGEVVSRRGLEDFSAAMKAIREITIRFTSEFAIRRFLRERPDETLSQLARWVADPNEHVRRLVSEGSRPLLPWGGNLPEIMANPQLTLPLLERLHGDPSEYVRRSVANHLNDFSKQHPKLVVETLARWKGEKHPGFDQLAHRAARTLVKKGDPAALALFGFRASRSLQVDRFLLAPDSLAVGDALTYSFRIRNAGRTRAAVLFDYAVHYQKKDGRLTPKVFKGRKLELAPGSAAEVEGRHVMRQVTTRTYHPGQHAFEILINGQSSGKLPFELTAGPRAARETGRPRSGRAGRQK